MNRSDSCFLIESSLSAGRPDYAREIARAWLAVWPGDLQMRFYLARATTSQNPADAGYALNLLDSITEVDFEYAAAHKLIGELRHSAAAYATAHAISGEPLPAGVAPPGWLAAARQAVTAVAAGQFAPARELAQSALRDESAPPLISLVLLKTHWQAGQIDLALPLAEGFHERWPKCAAIMLCCAEAYFHVGKAHSAVELLHTVSALDPAGSVVRRYWGASHSYTSLWPQPIEVVPPGPIPAEVIALLGLNRIGDGRRRDGGRRTASTGRPQPSKAKCQQQRGQTETRQPPSGAVSQKSAIKNQQAEELRDIQSHLNTISAQVNRARGYRRPTHVILFGADALRAKFGPEASGEIIGLIEQLAEVTKQQRGVPVALVAPDDPDRLAAFDLAAADPANPWAIKMLLRDLDRRLARKGRAIDSLLIVGGDDLIPFHRLPNPTDDVDGDIPSDNPYGTPDDNYFVPEWMVGRLPSPCGRDPEPLRRLLQNTIAAHRASPPGESWLRRMLRWLRRREGAAREPSVGYAASVWKEASLEAFAPIGSVDDLRTSPPLDSETAPPTNGARLSYFNLHGIEDSSDWYGQRDPADNNSVLYPVAFTPADVLKGGTNAPPIVFTEACYGANIIDKSEPDAALCLRFLHDGARALVGSTKIAYGSIGLPLIGADLLARYFWENLLAGLPAGEALRRAKLSLAQTMHKRQGFLDGEDQKTLITFLLYGDPLLPGVRPLARSRAAKSLLQIQTTAIAYETAVDDAPMQTIAEIKSLLAAYLPGAESASVRVNRPLPVASAKGHGRQQHRVYTLSKTIRIDSRAIPSFARVTVDKAGKVVKVAVSR